MLNFKRVLFASAFLSLATGVYAAPETYTKSTGDLVCPAGQRVVEPWEVKKDTQAACKALAEWDIARLAGGASLSGAGYKCSVLEGDKRKLGHTLCAKAPDLPNAAGTYAWSVNNATGGGETRLTADGTCSNSVSKIACVWKVSNPKTREFTLNWDNGRFVDTMTLSEDGKVISGKNQHNDVIKGTRK